MGGRSSREASFKALAAAWDSGITFYDTARSYGYGQSEGLLGEFFQGKRDSVVLCTKFGILPANPQGWKQRLKPLARGVLRALPGLRGAIRRQVKDQFLHGQFSPEAMRSSLETSLRELRTDYVDLLLLHAAPASVLEQDDLLEAMERLVESGKVRLAGISGEIPVIEKYFNRRPKVLKTAQFALNVSNIGFAETAHRNSDLLLVANHPFGGPTGAAMLKMTLKQMQASSTLSSALREKLDASDPQLLPEVVLNCILNQTGVSSVIPAMMQPRHIASNIRAIENCRFSSAELATLRSWLAQSDQASSI